MTIAVTRQQSFIRPSFSAQFLYSQSDGIFQGSVGCTTQNQSYLTNPGMHALSPSGWSSAGTAGHSSSGVRKYHA